MGLGVEESFTIGGTFAQTCRVWLRDLFRLTLIGLVCAAPLIIYATSLGIDLATARSPAQVAAVVDRLDDAAAMLILLAVGSAALAMGAITIVVEPRLRGDPRPIGATLARLARRTPAVLFTAVVLVAIELVPITVAGVLGAWAVWPLALLTWAPFYVALQVAAVEEGRALRRSLALTAGYRTRIFGALLLLAAIYLAALSLLTIGWWPLPSVRDATGEPIAASLVSIRSFLWGLVAIHVGMSSWFATFAVVTYHRLCRLQAPIRAQEAAAVFE